MPLLLLYFWKILFTGYWILAYSFFSQHFIDDIPLSFGSYYFWSMLFVIIVLCDMFFFLCFEDFPLYYWFSATWLWYTLGFKCLYFFYCDSLSFSDLRACSNSGSIYSRKMTGLWHSCSRALCCLTCLIWAISSHPFSSSTVAMKTNGLQITVKISSLVVTGKGIMGLKFFPIPISRDLPLFDLSGGSSGRPHLQGCLYFDLIQRSSNVNGWFLGDVC